jgi:L-malate glycosyltransferase
MKILVFAHDLVVCGTTMNAIELAGTLRDTYGYDVLLFATPGPMLKLVEQRDLRFVAAPTAQVHPSPARMLALRDVVRRERPDLIYAWEWQQCLDAYYVEHLLMGIPVVVTDMSMALEPRLPRELPITFGTPELVDLAIAGGHKHADLLQPPVDVNRNAPGVVDPQSFRERFNLTRDGVTLVTVSRLDNLMKAESLGRTVDAVRRLGRDLPIQLIIVGDGDARADLERLASEANAHLGRTAVVLTGPMLDPRPAYAAADIVIGMGSSALRGMAFGKPVVIVGEQGFSAPLTPETAGSFYRQGMYGRGDGNNSNTHLSTQIAELAAHPDQFATLGGFSRWFVVTNYSLDTIGARVDRFCRDPLTKVAIAPTSTISTPRISST